MKIAIIGTGYVGLVSGTCFAETGNHVLCVDIDQNKVAKLKSGKLTIYEPGLEYLFARNTQTGRLNFTTDIKSAVEFADIIFLALPTPPGEDGSADLSYILGVAEQIGPMLNGYKVIVDKSTVPVGTAVLVEEKLLKFAKKEDFDVVSNPEFLREGVAVDDFLKPDRVVVGTNSERAQKVMHKLYEPFVRQGNPIIFMDIPSAEMTKYAANSYLAARISFMNEVANLCELLGADVENVRRGMGADARIGKRFLFPGVGYGGSCFPKDVQAMAKSASDSAYDFKILNAVMAVNQRQRELFLKKVIKYFGENLQGKTFALWGLAFKPNTDDIREAPALFIIDELLKRGAKVQAFDPEAMENVGRIYGDKITLSEDEYSVLEGADALLILTEWTLFRTPEFDKMKTILKAPVIFDGRNLYDLDSMVSEGFYYNSIGRHIVNL